MSDEPVVFHFLLNLPLYTILQIWNRSLLVEQGTRTLVGDDEQDVDDEQYRPNDQ